MSTSLKIKEERSEETEILKKDLKEKEEEEEEDLEENAERENNKHPLKLKNQLKPPQLDLFVQIISNQSKLSHNTSLYQPNLNKFLHFCSLNKRSLLI